MYIQILAYGNRKSGITYSHLWNRILPKHACSMSTISSTYAQLNLLTAQNRWWVPSNGNLTIFQSNEHFGGVEAQDSRIQQ